ncbi:MAG: THUMP domain-containing protein [Desulfurococcales archaeon]|nr:THUMP domain-containing protein [Desulfurococcales archaeon]
MEWVVLVRYSEVAVKGRATRIRMEKLLVSGIREMLEREGLKGRPVRVEGRIIVEEPSNPGDVAGVLARVMGVKSASPAARISFRSLEDLVEEATRFFTPRARGKVFRVRARRAGSHSFTSKDVEKMLGARLLEEGAARVDLESPEYTAYIEVRDSQAYLYDKVHSGPGGLPIGSEDPVLVLYSGGFDSTVAAWRLLRRGSPVHLLYYDMGEPRALEIALEAARLLARRYAYNYRPRLYIAAFAGIAGIVRRQVKPGYQLLVLRRLMMEKAAEIALGEGIEAIATGESIGQVASQTIRNLYLISRMIDAAILRPLAGSDKDEIMEEARRIGVYDVVNRQIEVCGRAPTPTPRGDPGTFEEEYDKVRDLPAPQVRAIDLLGS